MHKPGVRVGRPKMFRGPTAKRNITLTLSHIELLESMAKARGRSPHSISESLFECVEYYKQAQDSKPAFNGDGWVAAEE